jgi:SnoaL-like protein
VTAPVTGPADAVVVAFLAIDRRDWAAVRAGLTDEVDADYTSLSGGEPERIAADALLERWRALLPGFDATQHHLGPLAEVGRDGDDRVTLVCTVRGYHRIDRREWMVAGSYALGVERVAGSWRIAAITLHVGYVDGDLDLPAEATARAAAAA